LIGLGRLGRVYARDLSSRIAQTRLVAVSDTNAAVTRDVAAQFDVPRSYDDPAQLIADKGVDAVVIVSPTPRTGARRGSARSEEADVLRKPPALTLAECTAMADAKAGSTFFQMGFMRRFDPGYAAAKRQIDEGKIGRPVVFKSTSRDPFPPSIEYANPKSSGGILIDMGIHDIDLARWFMGEVGSVQAIGATLVFPELATVGDRDNVIATFTFADGRLGERSYAQRLY
jgi:predicted dehydrogenase